MEYQLPESSFITPLSTLRTSGLFCFFVCVPASSLWQIGFVLIFYCYILKYRKCNVLKQHLFIISQFSRSEVQAQHFLSSGFYTQIKVLARPCFFLEALGTNRLLSFIQAHDTIQFLAEWGGWGEGLLEACVSPRRCQNSLSCSPFPPFLMPATEDWVFKVRIQAEKIFSL